METKNKKNYLIQHLREKCMTLAALKTFFEKSQPKLTNYRRYKFYGNKK